MIKTIAVIATLATICSVAFFVMENESSSVLK